MLGPAPCHDCGTLLVWNGKHWRENGREHECDGPTRSCLGCRKVLPASDYRRCGPRVARFCDDCLDRGLTPAQRRRSHLESQRAWRNRHNGVYGAH